MITTKELFDSYEPAYQTASWAGTITLMEQVGLSEHRLRSMQSGLGARVTEMCVKIARKPMFVSQNLHQWDMQRKNASPSYRTKQRHDALTQLGIYDLNGVSESFETALDIYNDQE